MKKLLMVAWFAAVAAYASPGAHGPNGEHLDAPSAITPNGLARLPDGSVNVPMLAQRRLAIRTIIAKESDAAATVELPGRVVMDPNAGGRVQTLSGGRVLPGPKGLPVAGQAVRKAEVLAYVVFNPNPIDAANQQAQLAEVRSGRQLAQQRVQRLESLEGTVLNGTEKSEVALRPSGANKLEAADVKIAVGSKVVASVTGANGKATTVRFSVK